MTTAEVLHAARTLITDPDKWCQGYDSERSCAVMALSRVTHDSNSGMAAIRVLDGFCGDQNIVTFNDSHSHAEVLALFDKAIHNASLVGVRD